MNDKQPWESKKFLMLFLAINWVCGLQIAGSPLDPTVASALLMAAGIYAGAQSYVDKSNQGGP